MSFAATEGKHILASPTPMRLYDEPGEIMENISGVVRRLRSELEKELERAKNEVERYGAALVALGSKSGVGQRRLSVAARKKIAAAQRARWAKVKAAKK
jgi:hypothetical protein